MNRWRWTHTCSSAVQMWLFCRRHELPAIMYLKSRLRYTCVWPNLGFKCMIKWILMFRSKSDAKFFYSFTIFCRLCTFCSKLHFVHSTLFLLWALKFFNWQILKSEEKIWETRFSEKNCWSKNLEQKENVKSNSSNKFSKLTVWGCIPCVWSAYIVTEVLWTV